MAKKKIMVIAAVLLAVVAVSAFAIVTTSGYDYDLYTINNNRTLVLRNNESRRLSVSLAVYTDANNACFYPTLTARPGQTDRWSVPQGQTIVSYDESSVSCD
jgi:hypothetical protein